MPRFAPPVLTQIDRLRWRNRVAALRVEPAQTVLHGLALAGFAAIAVTGIRSQHLLLQDLLGQASAHPLACLLALFVASAAVRHRQQRALIAAWKRDWLAAQPLPHPQRERYRWTHAGLRIAAESAVIGALLIGLGAGSDVIVSVLASGCAGAALGVWLAPAALWRVRRARRRGVFLPSGKGGLWRWQWQRAGSALAPAALAPWLGLWLLVPRGPAALIGVAILMLALAALTHAWLRMLGLFAEAQAWLAAEGVPPRRWVVPAMGPPALLWATACATLAAAIGLTAGPPALWSVLALGGMLALLGLLAAAGERRRPRRVALLVGVHTALLLGCAQTLPPLVPALWIGQCWVLLRRSLR